MLTCTLLLAVALSPAGCTPTANGASIDRSEYLSVNGARLYLQIRGTNRAAPILVWLHGGPGGAERLLFRYFNGELERHFLVVYWDQRGAGRSFDPKSDRNLLTVAQHVNDLNQVVDHLRRSFSRDKIVLMGHSWGAALGLLYTQAHADKVSAFVAVNPLVSTREGQRAEYDFVQAEAARRQDKDVLSQLAKIGNPPYTTVKQVLAMEKLVQRYDGIFHREPNRIWFVLRAIIGGLVRPWEIPRFIRANNLSLEAMNEELLSLDMTQRVPSIEVPFVMFLGRYDRHTDPQLAASYFAEMGAPIKRLVWFEESAHNVPFEEASLFNATVVHELQSVGINILEK